MESTLSIGDLLPAAVGIALSPLPIAAVILMLFSSRARVNGPVFLLGWIAGLALVGGTILILGGDSAGSSRQPSAASLWVKTVLGVLLLVLAVRLWRRRPRSEAEPAEPKWMQSIDSFTPGKALGIAALLSGVNPKNLALNAAGAVTISQAQMSAGGTWIAFAVFVLLSSATVIAPVAYYLVAGARAEARLESIKTWLIRNNAAVMSVLLLVFGVKLVAEGLQGLLT
jgi:threonine/homoserine/homoserine lactone efflux protein